ncbi:MAG: hypothetical protein KKE77_08615 [Alphaproteobacteria bacterium]|nr:hypothetical protein [Alphaproteobacteria bacterium]
MTKLSREDMVRHYGGLMGHIKFRLDTLANIVRCSNEDEGIHSAIVSGELGYLQVRKVCETLALATLIAHNQIEAATSKKFLKEYNAEAIFTMLARQVNPEGFPQAVMEWRGNTLTLAAGGPMDRTELKQAYIRSHTMLHTGGLADIFANKEVRLDFRELTTFHNRFVELLSVHAVALPEIETILLCALNHGPSGGKVHVRLSQAKRNPPHDTQPHHH